MYSLRRRWSRFGVNMEHTQSNELLRTKLFFPAPEPTLLPRLRLIQRVNESRSRKCTLISAPAGYGKTTLTRIWAEQARQPVAWLTLEETDNDPVRFWNYVIAALQTIHASIGHRILPQFQTTTSLPLEALLTSLINDLASLSQPFTFILDDYHCIRESAIHQSLRFFLDRLPPSLHLMIMTRTDPPLGLAHRRAQRELIELRSADLCFTLEETQQLLKQELTSPIAPSQIETLYALTEGWPAALQLAILFLRGATDLSQAIAEFTGSHHYIMDYLIDEVLAHQPKTVRTFLLSTALLDRLTGDLCNALTGSSHGQEMLEQLESANLFLLPLDAHRHWYRYNHLFAHALRKRAIRELGQEQYTHVYRLASAWYEQHGFLHEAIEAALMAADYTNVIRIFATPLLSPVLSLMLAGQYHTISRWLRQLPEDVLRDLPGSYTALAWVYLLAGQHKEMQESLRKAEQFFTRSGNRIELGRLTSMRAMLACFQFIDEGAINLGQEALALLPEDFLGARGIATISLGLGYCLQGEVILAKRTLIEARLISEQTGNTSITAGCALLSGTVLMLQGKLTQAITHYQQVIDDQQTWVPFASEALLRIAALLFERNDLSAATMYVERALRFGQQRKETFLIARCMLLQARILQASGEPSEQIEEAFIRAVVLARQSQHSYLLDLVYAYQARWWLAAGNKEATQQWFTTYSPISEEIPTYKQEVIALTAVRVLIARGDSAASQQILERWSALAHTQGRVGSQIEMLLLRSRAADAQSLITKAVSYVQQALLLAEDGQYVQVFVEEGASIKRLLSLLQLQWSKQNNYAYLGGLINAIPSKPLEYQSTSSSIKLLPLLDPLSPREYAVLRLLAAGLSAREIADELTVSLNTIKTQLKSVYRKLNATSRQEALACAHYRKLL